ncbi:MAG: hypothetical protein LUH19_01960 [Lachnospiraceae bacterium]|nr:hypothetical protein [Lachnospiraceae bacterium]
MEEQMIRLLRADEIECRIGTINEKGLSLLLFKDARVDQKILDEIFTPFGWKRSHQVIDGNLYCTVEIWDTEKGQWVAKQDVGSVSYSEKEKGQASDSFKRACFNWGIGRELYTAPFIWIPAIKVPIQPRGDRYVCYEHFSVAGIAYDGERNICGLTIINGKGQAVYQFCQAPKQEKQKEQKEQNQETDQAGQAKQSRAAQKRAPQNQEQEIPFPDGFSEDSGELGFSSASGISLEQEAAFGQELIRTGVPLETVLDRYRLASTGEMTREIYESAMRVLKKCPNKEKAA